MTAEGRIVPDEQGGFDYQYFLKDHLGSTRVLFNSAGPLEVDSYYPFGMLMEGFGGRQSPDSENKYLYNGKEVQDDFRLDWYDYGARFYDATLGRWHVVDPLAEEYNSQSPYHFSGNNPMFFIDNNGMNYDGYTVDDAGKIEWVDNTGGDKYDVLYKKSEYDSGNKNYDYLGTDNTGIRIDDKSVITALRTERPELLQEDYWAKGNFIQGYYATPKNENEAKNLFFFLAKSTTKEWTYQKNEGKKFIVGTLKASSQALRVSGIEGFGYNTAIEHWHSHGGDKHYDFQVSGVKKTGDMGAAAYARSINTKVKFFLFMPQLTKEAWNKVFPRNKINYEPQQIIEY